MLLQQDNDNKLYSILFINYIIGIISSPIVSLISMFCSHIIITRTELGRYLEKVQ